MTNEEKKELFDKIFEAMSEYGLCDSIGGMEYKRKFREWVAAGASVRDISRYCAD